MATGTVLTVKSNLGIGPWHVFHMGLSYITPLSFGQVNQVVGIVIVGLGYLLGIKPTYGTIANMIMFGTFADMVNNSGVIPVNPPFPIAIIYVIVGTITFGIGTGLYMNMNMGAGPRDGLMVGLNKKMGLSVGKVRTSMELTVLVAGYFLGGPLGIGTLIFALFVGHTVQWSLRHIKVEVKVKADEVPGVARM
jgi:uncharacterized membrane protein YczE